jgi:hypothetical protein
MLLLLPRAPPSYAALTLRVVTIDKLSDTLVNIGSYIHGHTSFAGVRSSDEEEKPFAY